ncbi:hypothetical protein CDG77_10355 [Nostoc sp. 'Peltigera membranacea cyanobiont' 213]|nr:hypothetical protein CDG77_10355 [Nostoc sp. 'Peltigera membranacea cyanobiont' 213]
MAVTQHQELKLANWFNKVAFSQVKNSHSVGLSPRLLSSRKYVFAGSKSPLQNLLTTAKKSLAT